MAHALLTYPLIRYQTLFQTEHTSGHYTTLSNRLKANRFAYSFRGIVPYFIQTALTLQGNFFGGVIAGSAFYITLYPFQNLQILQASAPLEGKGQLSTADIFKNYLDGQRWRGLYGGVASVLATSLFGLTLFTNGTLLFAPFVFAGQVAIDNVRRNLVVQSHENGKVNYKEVYTDIYAKQGPKGFLRGALFYPQLYVILLAPFVKQYINA
jgi:hypothetical protein